MLEYNYTHTQIQNDPIGQKLTGVLVTEGVVWVTRWQCLRLVPAGEKKSPGPKSRLPTSRRSNRKKKGRGGSVLPPPDKRGVLQGSFTIDLCYSLVCVSVGEVQDHVCTKNTNKSSGNLPED